VDTDGGRAPGQVRQAALVATLSSRRRPGFATGSRPRVSLGAARRPRVGQAGSARSACTQPGLPGGGPRHPQPTPAGFCQAPWRVPWQARSRAIAGPTWGMSPPPPPCARGCATRANAMPPSAAAGARRAHRLCRSPAAGEPAPSELRAQAMQILEQCARTGSAVCETLRAFWVGGWGVPHGPADHSGL
jgi:hypothetical protein